MTGGMTGGTSGAARMADALLRTLGGRTGEKSVLLRMPQPALPGDPGEQTGLVQPTFQDTPLIPAAFRRQAGELLVSASAVERIVGSLAFDSARILFATAAGIVIDEELYPVVSIASAEAFGQVYLWRITVRKELA